MKELFRSLINIGDVVGVYFVLTSIGGAYGSELRILGIAVGIFAYFHLFILKVGEQQNLLQLD